MHVSLICATVGRVDEVNRLLESLTNQSYKAFDLIVVDQSSTTQLERLVESYANSLQITYVRDSGRGLSRARNIGLGYARGEIIGFPDDDCEYDSAEVLGRVCRVFVDRSDIGMLLGRSHGRNGVDNKMGNFLPVESDVSIRKLHRQMVEYSLWVRSSGSRSVRFDESLGVGAGTPWCSGEGPDYVIRLLKLGVRGYYAPAISIYHPNKVTKLDEDSLRRAYGYNCGLGRVFLLHSYPVDLVLVSLARSLAGVILYSFRLNKRQATFYWLCLKGKLVGLASKPPAKADLL